MNRILVLLLILILTLTVSAQPPAWAAANKAAMSLYKQGQYKTALPVAESAVELARKSGDQLAIGMTTNTQAMILWSMGHFKKADTLFADALEKYENDPRLGPDHEYTAHVYKNRALCLRQLDQLKLSETYYLKALHSYELLDPKHNHPDTLNIVQGLADVLFEQNRLKDAREHFLEILSKVADNTESARLAKEGLAGVEREVGNLKTSRTLYQELTEYYKLTDSRSDYPKLIRTMTGLAGVQFLMGDYSSSETLYKRALRIAEKTRPEHPSLAKMYNNLALFYSDIGDLTQAERLYLKALKIHESLLGPEHTLTATSLNNLASLYAQQQRFIDAEPLYQRAHSIAEKVTGPGSSQTLTALNNLSTLYLKMNRAEQAHSLLNKALKELAQVPSDKELISTLFGNLGSAQHQLGRLTQAEKSFKKALSYSGPQSLEVNNNLSYLAIDQGHRKKALRFARVAAEAEFQRLKKIFSFTSERQRIEYKRALVPYGLFASLGNADALFQTALRYKGAVLDSIVEDHRLAQASSDPKVREILTNIQLAKRQLLEIEVLPEDDPRRKEAEPLRGVIESGEAQLARDLVNFKKSRTLFEATPKRVQNALSPNTVLVEFIYHGFYEGFDKSEKRYSALVITPRKIELVPLGSAKEITQLVEDFRDQIQGKRLATRAARVTVSKRSAGREPTSLRQLYDKLWKPIQAKLPKGTKTAILSPDGELNFVSFAIALSPKGRFVGEDFDLVYVASGRDLIKDTDFKSSGKEVLFGDPIYTERESSGASGINLAPLPGTAAECHSLEKLLENRGQAPVVNLGAQATEIALMSLTPKRLHIATHGFFLGESFGPQGPMARSGLAFTGAQDTLDAWADGQAPDPKNDGLLTAQEVGGLNLSHTDLVVLSACDTGLGASETGEGVLGLRRGFVQSGAKNLLFTLWPISDQETALFMADFYGVIGESEPIRALNQTQRSWLTRLREKEGPLNAAKLAGPFVMSVQGEI